MNYHKGFIVPLLLALIALLLAGGAYVYVQKNQTNQLVTGNVALPQATSTTPTSNSQTADWKTYTNVQYGFSFKYPNNYSNTDPSSSLALASAPQALFNLAVKDGDIMQVYVLNKVFDPTNIQSLYGKIQNPEMLTIDNKDAYGFGNADAGCSQKVIEMALGRQTLKFSFSSCEGNKAPFLGSDLQNQILSTFKFIQTTSTTQAGIVVTSPKPNELVKLPITVHGQINGNGWIANEGETGLVQVFDANGKAISSVAILTATTDWLKLPTSFQTMVGDRQMMSYITTPTGYLKFTSKEEQNGQTQLTFIVPIRFK